MSGGLEPTTQILLTGASGLLGRALFAELSGLPGAHVVGTALRRCSEPLVRLDLLDPSAVTDLVLTQRPDIIVHSAAERRPDVCEGQPGIVQALNVDATLTLAVAAARVGSWMMYISTDYVFDGAAPPYRPDHTPNPLNRYGQSKLQGEIAVRETLPDHAILRIPILYGPCLTPDESPVTRIAHDLISGERSPIDNWATRYPTLVGDVAAACAGMVRYKGRNPGFSGTYHWSGPDPLTKYGMAVIIADLLRIPRQEIVPDNRPPSGAPRPRNTHLDCRELQGLGIGKQTPFVQGIRTVLEGAPR